MSRRQPRSHTPRWPIGAAAALACSLLLPVAWGQTAQKKSTDEPGAMQRAGNAVERGVKAAAGGVERGVSAAASGVRRAGDAVARGAQAAGSAVNRGAKKIGLPADSASAPKK